MLKVLLVDDNNTILQGLLRLVKWEEMGLTVAGTFRNGAEALRFIQKTGEADIIFTDIKMPVMDGLTLIKRIHETGIQAEFICLSGFDEYALVREAFILGAEDYLLKTEIEPEKVQALCEKLVKKLMETKYHSAPDTDNHVIHAILQLIETSYKSDLSLKNLSVQFGISSGYLGQLFYKETNLSFSDYLNNKRIREASEMIRSGEYKIYEIAEACGYNNVEHFSRIFKKVTGKSPKNWF